MPTTNNATNPSGAKTYGAAANRNRPSEPEDLADQIDEIRAEIQNLTGSIRAAASNQIDQAQLKAQELDPSKSVHRRGDRRRARLPLWRAARIRDFKWRRARHRRVRLEERIERREVGDASAQSWHAQERQRQEGHEQEAADRHRLSEARKKEPLS